MAEPSKAQTKGFNNVIDRGNKWTPAGGDGVTFAPDPSTINRKSLAPAVFKFPLDDVSAGNFWTRLVINSWTPTNRPEIVAKANHGLAKYLISNIWLPMPLSLATSYNQNYSESDNMMLNRGSGMDLSSMKGLGSTFFDQAGAAGKGAANEGVAFVSAIANINNSGKMNLGSIMNQQMGLVYDGATLRQHTLSWRMTPKSREEQDAIQKVVFALKKYSSPIVKGALGGDVNLSSSKVALEESTAMAKAADTEKSETADAKAVLGDSMRNIGRLGIPATVNVEFWYGDKINPHLFQIKDSFILSVEVNYTPTGTWNAYEDGAPVETQLTINLKENAIVTQGDISDAGGY